MRNLILWVVAAVLPFLANAQKIELGANFGVNNSHTPVEQFYVIPAFSFKAAYNVCSGFQAGISSNINWQAYEVEVWAWPEDINPNIEEHFFQSLTQAIHSITAFGNAKKQVGRAVIYGGISGGYIHALRNSRFIASGPRNGYTAGGQAGVTWYVSKRWGINAEAGANYVNMTGKDDYNRDDAKSHLSTWSYPVSLGIRYQLFCACSHKCPLSGK